MEISNSFEVDRPVEETWKILTDLEFIAPCFPGAQLTEIEGEEYRGIVKIKVGPISAKYSGKASFLEQNSDDHTARLKAEGRDPRQGNANALVTATMEPSSETSTVVTVHTDLSLSGKIASFGRGAIEDISGKILGQFVDNLRDKLAQTDNVPLAEPAVGSTSDATAEGATVRKIDSPEATPVDLLAVSGNTIGKRLAPVFGVILVIVVLRWLLRRRG
jgi:carbon monoxide dehydrogenase subunit G